MIKHYALDQEYSIAWCGEIDHRTVVVELPKVTCTACLQAVVNRGKHADMILRILRAEEDKTK